MARNLKFFFDESGSPCARGPQSEKLLMNFLETDIQGDDHICHDLMEDLDAVNSGAAAQREFTGNAHTVVMLPDGITIESNVMDDDAAGDDAVTQYKTSLRHFREIVEDWEAFILDEADNLPGPDDLPA